MSALRFGRGALSGLAGDFPFPGGRAFLVSSPAVLRFHGDRIRAALPPRERIEIEVPDGEAAKTFDSLRAVLDRALAAGIRRDDFVIAAGGGTVTDSAGFAAAILLRGVAWYAVPTTLLGMADAAIGGKTGIDHPLAKNAIGAFHPASGILVDPDFLETLAPRAFRDGIVEIFKALLVGSGAAARAMAGRLETAARGRAIDDVLREAIRVKQEIVARDPREAGERRALNFGHTLGHAVETAGDYSRFSHGEAVAIGMAAALRISVRRAGFPAGDAAAIGGELVEFAGGRDALPEWSGAIDSALGRDKKNTAGRRSAVLLADFGRPVIAEVAAAQWKDALSEIAGPGAPASRA